MFLKISAEECVEHRDNWMISTLFEGNWCYSVTPFHFSIESETAYILYIYIGSRFSVKRESSRIKIQCHKTRFLCKTNTIRDLSQTGRSILVYRKWVVQCSSSPVGTIAKEEASSTVSFPSNTFRFFFISCKTRPY